MLKITIIALGILVFCAASQIPAIADFTYGPTLGYTEYPNQPPNWGDAVGTGSVRTKWDGHTFLGLELTETTTINGTSIVVSQILPTNWNNQVYTYVVKDNNGDTKYTITLNMASNPGTKRIVGSGIDGTVYLQYQVPEPATIISALLGLLGFAVRKFRG